MELLLNNLSFSYHRKRPPVLSNISLALIQGGIVGLLGPNGAGKSTLLNLIAGLLTPGKGDVTFNGINTRLRLPYTLSQIYLVGEEPTLPKMSLKEFVAKYSVFYPNFRRDIMDNCLNEFDMISPDNLHALSMGQRKKIVLSFAMACRPDVLLMDEPTNGLDIPGKAAFRRIIAQYATDEQLFLISTHQVRDVDTILDRVMIMNQNSFVLNETVERLQQKLRFERGLRTSPDNAIYAIPSLNGVDAVMPNELDSESDLNLELLFEATLKHSSEISRILAQ